MKPFTFALEPLLLARRATESQKQQAFNAAQQRLSLVQKRLSEIERDIETVLAEARPDARHLRQLDALTAMLQAEIAERKPEVERVRHEFEIAMHDRKVLELLKERKRARYDAMVARKEEAELDEANSA